MRMIDMIVVHCSATRSNRRYPLEQLRHDHVAVNGWRDIGYHFYITLDGVVHPCRPIERMGAHARGYNAHSIGICYEGGLDAVGNPKDTRTDAQKTAIRQLIMRLKKTYPLAVIVGHRDLNPQKACPCFNAVSEYRDLQP